MSLNLGPVLGPLKEGSCYLGSMLDAPDFWKLPYMLDWRKGELAGRHAGFAVRVAKKTVRDAKFSHLGRVGPPCSPVGRPFLHLGPQNLNVDHHFHQSVGPFTISRFYYFISIGFQAGGFRISGRKT